MPASTDKSKLDGVKQKLADARLEVFERVSIQHDKWVQTLRTKGIVKDRSEEGFAQGWLADSKRS